jgi:transposase
MARPISIVELDPEEEAILRQRVRARSASKRDRLRASIILRRAEGLKQADIAEELGVSIPCVNKWSQRFEREGLPGLAEKPGRGRKPSLPVDAVARVIEEAGKAPDTRTRWTTRTMAEASGISQSSVQRIWKANDLKPHLTDDFKLSKDPRFEEKFWDVIGLYLNPPERALVLCCDEKSQCQALERSQLGLSLNPRHKRTRTHDYIRHGTITLFAALDYLDGKLISRTEARHTHVEWLRFLKQFERESPAEVDIHLIIDNYCTHKHEKVKAWLARRPRFHVHFTPTGSTLVEPCGAVLRRTHPGRNPRGKFHKRARTRQGH